MFWADEYLNQVASQIRVKRARGPLTDELREHLECQREAYVAEGMDEAEARRRAVADMGDALLVGGELDRVHRPRTQWNGVFIALFLIALGLLLQRVFLPEGAEWIDGTIQGAVTAAAVALLALLAATDYTFWIRLTLPISLLWLFNWVIRLRFSIGWVVELLHMPYEFSRILMGFSPECLGVTMLPLLALSICRLRGRGWRALLGCALWPLMIVLLAFRYEHMTWANNAVLLTACLGFGILLCAVRRGFFRVNRRGWSRGIAAAGVLTLGRFAADFAHCMGMIQPWMTETVHPLLRGARLLGAGRVTLEAVTVEYSFSSYDLLPLVICRFGWLPFAALTCALAGLIAWCLARFARMENRMGALLGLTATAAVAAQCVLFYLASFTNYTQDMGLPLLSYGMMMLLIDAALVGIILSALRGESVPEAWA